MSGPRVPAGHSCTAWLPGRARLRAKLLARVYSPAEAWASLDTELAGDLAVQACDGSWEPPEDDEGAWSPDDGDRPLEGEDAWLADLPSELQDEYLEAIRGRSCRTRSRPGSGTAVQGMAGSDLPPGVWVT
ncbi:MAG TPA: hypothetical protein VGS19_19325 [Streptosporangiaceae bacterium]|nr:hypothetical protein [Streptosporangiaceae bacterium]